MRLNRTVLLAVLSGFALGAGAMRLTESLRSQSHFMLAEPVLQAELACPMPNEPAAAVPATKLPGMPLVGSQQARAPLAAAPASANDEAISAIRKPQTGIATSSEARLSQLLERPLPHGREIVRNDRDDGGVMTYEELDDGASINRSFSARGDLLAESLFTIAGEEIQKGYYENGGLMALSWLRPDGSRSDVKMRRSGLLEARQDVAADGSKIDTKYDEHGVVTGRWRVLPGGRAEKLNID